jgi:hypothetical protein
VVTTPGHAGPAVAIADGPMGPVASVPADRWPRAPELADGPDSPSSGLAPVVAPPPELVASPPTTDPAVTSLPLPGARPAATPLPLPDARPAAILPPPQNARPAAILPPPQNARPAATLPPSGVDVRADAPHQPASPAFGASLLRGLIALAAAALIFQLVGFALRPLRRMLTLRHLRTPLWDETVDQRVSNSWQLALVGLRDAGWCPGASEPPQALARRVGIDSLERCATILERARHGLGVDAEDLAIMRASADDAYRAARTDLGAFARAVGYMRWPLT